MSKEDFKLFVRKNPELIDYVRNDKMTWQKFYEIYEMYGEDNKVWSEYRGIGDIKTTPTSLLGDTSLKDLFNVIKKVDMNSVKKGLDGIQKAVSLFQDISSNRSNRNLTNEQYQARPMYKYFED